MRRLLRRAAWGLCVATALPGCITPAGFERSDPPADFQVPARQSTPPTTRGQVDSGQVTPVRWLRPGEVPPPSTVTGVVDPGPTSQRLATTPAIPQSLPEAPVLHQPPKTPAPKPLDVPPGVPGAETPRIVLPPDTPTTRAERLKVIDSLFPEFAPLGPDPIVDGMPGVKAVSLEELLEFARKNSPEIAQASADVADAHGHWVQVGLHPNPTVGFQGDQIFDTGPFGQFGGFVNQPIVTGGKLKLARSVAYFDYLNAQVHLRKAEVELARRVRANYYAALVAAENVRVSRLLVAFTDEVYRRQVALVKGGTAAPFEASALLAITGQAELALSQSRNGHTSAWKQLAASINAADLPPAPLVGKADEALPRYRYEALRQQMLAGHTDILVARNSVVQAERTILREQAKPIPDVQNQFYFQQDTAAKAQGLPNFQMGAQIGVQVPLFDRNQGGIMSARAQFARAAAEVPRVQNSLTQQLVDAFGRYESARQQTTLYRERILPNLVTAFRGVYQRYQLEPDKVNYNDIVTAQQNLVTQLAGYLQALQLQWQAQSDLAGAVQVTDPVDLARTPESPNPDTWPGVEQRMEPPKPSP